MKVGIMGGTFDPVHLGHLLAAEQAADWLGLDEVRFMPTNDPPHKANAPHASAAHRLAMVELAIDDRPGFRAADDELKRGGTSYTFDTVSQLLAREPGLRLHFIIGADMVMYLPNWHRIDELVRMAVFVGMQRPGYALQLDALPDEIRQAVQLVPIPAVDISSTDIRERLLAGRSVRYLLPEPVRYYIKEKGLYGTG